MAIWSNATKTNQGLILEQKLKANSLPLKLTSAKSGAGKVNPTQLAAQTAVMSLKQTLALKRGYVDGEDNTLIVPVMLSNIGLGEQYNLFQVGVYAEDPDRGEILYFIAQTDITAGEVIPAENETPGFSIDWNFAFNVSNTATVEVTVNEAGKLTIEQADKRYAPQDSPTLTGIPVAPTAVKGTSSDQIATTLFVTEALAEFTGGGVVVSGVQPEKTNVLWIDTASQGVAKYFDGTNWVAVTSTWG